MKNDILMDAIGFINDDTIADAHSSVARKRYTPGKRFIAIAAAIVFAFAASVSAMAVADVDAAYELLYQFSPSIAQMLKPINKSCEDNGIRMEVISAEISGSEAYIYISMEDMTGERIDGTIDLYDSYDINRNFDCAAYCELINYDETTGKAVFLIHMESMDGSSIRGGKVTFSVRELLCNKNIIHDVLPIDLTQAADAMGTKAVSPDMFRGDTSSEPFLIPQEGGVYSPGDGAQITAMGYIDGKLHIQIRYDKHCDGKWYYDNHGFLSLLDENGEQVMIDYYEFWGGKKVTHKTDWQVFSGYESYYQEYIVDISPEELHRYSLYADLWLCDTRVEGDWEVTFSLKNSQ